ncbi:polysaccharide biosynthesis tyrosine autokinase [Symmachiella dynata]|uniref:polysaccharide biosynthesis tyrosine autokinase n=1 Tax=Symmachiella dynata TaxID=2527995 RepID=UPI001189DF62|nr:polysaccharide biosynthesis tyrosine autokinase [Symmachiella dynata]QDT46413.1 Tyrosine-protein kinase YwqD [Symmachiella dynata]
MMQSNQEPNHYRNGNAGVPAYTNGGGGGGGGALVPVGNGMEPSPASMGGNEGAGQVDPKALLNAFRRRWFLAVTVGLFCGGSAAAAVYLLVPPNYVASSIVYIDATPGTVLQDSSSFSSDFDTFKRTQMFRALQRVVLDTALSEPVRNGELKQYGFKTIGDLPLIKAQAFPIDWLEARLSASGRQEEFFAIKMEYSEKPEELAEIVNAITQVYYRDIANESKLLDKKRIAMLIELSDDYEQETKKKLDEIAKLGRRLGITSEEELSLDIAADNAFSRELQQQYFDLTIMRYNLKLETRITEKIGDTVEENPDIQAEMIETLIDRDPKMADLLVKADAIEANIRRYEETLKDTENNSVLKSARREQETTQEAIAKYREELRPIIEQKIRESGNAQNPDDLPAEERIARMDVILEQLKEELDNRKIQKTQIVTDSFELQQLQKEAAKLEARTDEINNKIDVLKIELGAPDRIKVAQWAEVPRIKDWESLYKKSAMAGLGVFGLFVAAIVWFEFQAKRIDTLGDVTGGLNLRIMGALPQMPRWASQKSSKAKKTAKSAFWHSVLTESIDAARTVLIRDANVESTRLVMVGSAISGEGKTTLSCHLAASLARVGRNTLLVDCDFRKSNVHRVFGVEEQPGLSEVLLGTASLEEAIKSPSDDGPDVLPAGQFNSQLLAALAQDGLGKIFEELKKKYEFVVVDSSPVLPVTDSLMVAQHVDAVILSIRRDVSRRPKVAATRDRLAMLGVPVLGAVVIGLDGETSGYRSGYGGYGYGSRYGYGYQYNRSPEPTPSQS